MPAPDPYSIWIEPVMGGSLVMYYQYFGTGKAGNRKKRVAMLFERLSQGDWFCRWCSDSIAIWRRTDARLDLSRLRSGLSPHLCGLSLECQGAFAAKR